MRAIIPRPLRSLSRYATVPRRVIDGVGRQMSSSTVAGRSAIQNLVQEVAQTQPSFSLSGDSVKVLSSPKEFYNTLTDMINRAKRRIVLSSLYIGTAESDLIRTLHNALHRNPDLTLDLHLDYLRSTRPETPSTAEFLLPLIKSYGDQRVKVHLFKTPKLRGVTAKVVPRRFDEGWGTWHAKLYAVDDEVMVSGANLNSSYFNDRQDRYLHFTAQPGLTEYAVEFARTLVPFTHRLVPIPGAESDAGPYCAEWRNPDAGPTSFEGLARDALQDFQERWRTAAAPDTGHADTTILPVLQSGVLGVREEEKAIRTVFDAVSRSQVPVTVDLTSGYFGLYAPYKRRIIASPPNARWRIVAASPKANGFYGSKGLSGRLPEAYTWLEREFWKSAAASGKAGGSDNSIELSEWERDGWTYHAKGIW
ncbi:CDP-diacylglycerol--glycerol-3-phosphate 3-phosphatidyltransferase, partial [Tulasnella sp. 403]